MRRIEGGVTAPRGFRAAGVAAGIKAIAGKKDCALIVSDAPASVAGTFTTNVMKAAPVRWTERVCSRGEARAVFLNSGNANACTGAQGDRAVEQTARLVARVLGIEPENVCVCSTGVIGAPLPMDRIEAGVEACARSLSVSGSREAAEAIMTTDTVPKEFAFETALGIRIGVIAKGAGMIAPRMAGPCRAATMLCVITTDATIGSASLAQALERAVAVSFNRISVDNDTSTNDTVLCLSNGQAGQPTIEPGTAEYAGFEEVLRTVCEEAAKALVRDGEGATKRVEIVVRGAASDREAEAIARSIGQSQLCKTAFFGEDPNWGRIACAAGYAGAPFNPEDLAIWLDDIQVLAGGQGTAYEEAAAAAVLKRGEFQVRVSIGDGPGKAVFWTADLSSEYVRVNAAYRS